MGHDGVASGYPTPTVFYRLTGCEWDPRDKGVTQVVYWVELPEQRRLYPIFEKIWIPINGTQ